MKHRTNLLSLHVARSLCSSWACCKWEQRTTGWTYPRALPLGLLLIR